MATLAIGDVHGCFESLQTLLDHIDFDPRRDRLWFVGDLVNRGPASLAVLRFVKGLGEGARVVLGNHDLHLLARAAGVVDARRLDTLDEVLGARDSAELLAWLCSRPLFYREGPWAMVHAGLFPAWTLDEAEELAAEVGEELAGGERDHLLARLRQPPFPAWSPRLPRTERYRLALVAFTLLRGLTPDGRPFERYAGPPAHAPVGFKPWFAVPHAREAGSRVLFGHWAALDLHITPEVVGLDTGCAWGGRLTAFRLEDGKVFQIENREGIARR